MKTKLIERTRTGHRSNSTQTNKLLVRESSLHVTNTAYSGLQEHRIIVHTATGQKAKPKLHLSTESTVTGNSSKTPEACRRETEEHKLKTAV
jgi:hypothetical protein